MNRNKEGHLFIYLFIDKFVLNNFWRLYLINSPVVRAETLKFQEKGVKDVIKDVFLPWYNAHRFLVQNIQQMERVSLSETNQLKLYEHDCCTC